MPLLKGVSKKFDIKKQNTTLLLLKLLLIFLLLKDLEKGITNIYDAKII